MMEPNVKQSYVRPTITLGWIPIRKTRNHPGYPQPCRGWLPQSSSGNIVSHQVPHSNPSLSLQNHLQSSVVIAFIGRGFKVTEIFHEKILITKLHLSDRLRQIFSSKFVLIYLDHHLVTSSLSTPNSTRVWEKSQFSPFSNEPMNTPNSDNFTVGLRNLLPFPFTKTIKSTTTSKTYIHCRQHPFTCSTKYLLIAIIRLGKRCRSSLSRLTNSRRVSWLAVWTNYLMICCSPSTAPGTSS